MALNFKIKPQIIEVPYLGKLSGHVSSLKALKWALENAECGHEEYLRRYLCEVLNADISGVDKLSYNDLQEVCRVIGPFVLAQLDRKDSSNTNYECATIAEFRSELGKIAKSHNDRVTRLVERTQFYKPTHFDQILTTQNQIQSMFDRIQAATRPLQQIYEAHQIINQDLLNSHLQIADITHSLTTPFLRSPFSQQGASATQIITDAQSLSAQLYDAIGKSFLEVHSFQAWTREFSKPGFFIGTQLVAQQRLQSDAFIEAMRRYTDNSASLIDPIKLQLSSLDKFEDEYIEVEELIETAEVGLDVLERSANSLNIPVVFAILHTLLMIIPILMNLADNSEEYLVDLTARMSALETKYSDELEKEKQSFLHDRMLTGRYHLREEPHRHAKSITILWEDRMVTVKETRGDWAKVVVFPYGNEPQLEGWIHRRGLAPVISLVR